MTLPSTARPPALNAWTPHAFFNEVEPDEAGHPANVLTVLLRNRRCPWKCIYCDLWKQALNETVPHGAIPAQIDVALEVPADPLRPPRQLKLYNAGSFFDRAAIPTADYPAIAERCRRFEKVVVECHPSLIDDGALRFREMLGGCRLEVAMGLEIADDAILKKLNKRMTTASFARAAEVLARHGVALRAFVIVKPPFVTSEEEGIEAAVRSAKFAWKCGANAVSLIPARFGTEALDKLAGTGDFSPPSLGTVETVFDRVLTAGEGRVFVDLWNPAFTKSCPRCYSARTDRLSQMNLVQRVLPAVMCSCS